MKNRRMVTTLLFVIASLLSACDQSAGSKQAEDAKKASAQTGAMNAVAATTIFVNADIVTVDDSKPAAQAMAVRDGRVLAVGSRQDVELAAGEGAEVRDMQGKTIVPGLIDAHGHISLTAMSKGLQTYNHHPPAR